MTSSSPSESAMISTDPDVVSDPSSTKMMAPLSSAREGVAVKAAAAAGAPPARPPRR
jgi:hypothetical protein